MDHALEAGPLPKALAVIHLADQELESRLRRLATIERKALTILLAHLGEFDRRRLFADRGQPSLFQYCVCVLGYSEQAAYKRIQAARATREFPLLLEHLWRGELHLAAIVILAPHFRKENLHDLIDTARGKSKHELELLVASLAPRPDTPDLLRALPLMSSATNTATSNSLTCAIETIPRIPAPAAPAAAPREIAEPLSPERFLFRFTGNAAMHTKYTRLTKLMGIKTDRRMEAVFEAALDSLLDRRDPERRARRRQARKARAASPGHSDSRTVPQALRDEVWRRDSGRCAFLNTEGSRCPATSWLEIDHIKPYALGGARTTSTT